jgi:glycosyltransferase involved in cell wall biosynthesis
LRSELGIPPQAPVLGFVGRLTRDKGIPELMESFLQVSEQFPDLRLLLLGSTKEEDSLDDKTLRVLDTHPRIILAGETLDTAPFYALMDVLVLPSHREGFPNVVLEAYAAGKPVVAARATGTIDAVVDGKTGLLFPVGDVTALVRCLQSLLSDKVAATRLGCSGQELIKLEFRQEMVWNALNEEYWRLLQIRSPSYTEFPVRKRASDFVSNQ